MRKVFRRAGVVVCLAAVCSTARAQEQPGASNPWVHLSRVTVHPGAVTEFEDYVKKVQASRVKLGLPHESIAYQTVMGGSPFEYHFITPFANWAEIDALPAVPALVTKAFGDVEGAKILKAGRSTITGVTIEVYRLRLDLSTNPKLGAPPAPFATLTITEHHRETVGPYLRSLARVKKAEEQDPSSPPVYRYVITHGEAPMTVAARPSSTLAERDKWPSQNQVLRKALGEGEQQDLSDLFAKSIAKRATVVIAYRPDLSRLNRPATASQP